MPVASGIFISKVSFKETLTTNLSTTQSAEYGTFRRDLRCARKSFFCSLLSILNSLLKISGVQVPYSAHQSTTYMHTTHKILQGKELMKIVIRIQEELRGQMHFGGHSFQGKQRLDYNAEFERDSTNSP